MKQTSFQSLSDLITQKLNEELNQCQDKLRIFTNKTLNTNLKELFFQEEESIQVVQFTKQFLNFVFRSIVEPIRKLNQNLNLCMQQFCVEINNQINCIKKLDQGTQIKSISKTFLQLNQQQVGIITPNYDKYKNFCSNHYQRFNISKQCLLQREKFKASDFQVMSKSMKQLLKFIYSQKTESQQEQQIFSLINQTYLWYAEGNSKGVYFNNINPYNIAFKLYNNQIKIKVGAPLMFKQKWKYYYPQFFNDKLQFLCENGQQNNIIHSNDPYSDVNGLIQFICWFNQQIESYFYKSQINQFVLFNQLIKSIKQIQNSVTIYEIGQMIFDIQYQTFQFDHIDQLRQSINIKEQKRTYSLYYDIYYNEQIDQKPKEFTEQLENILIQFANEQNNNSSQLKHSFQQLKLIRQFINSQENMTGIQNIESEQNYEKLQIDIQQFIINIVSQRIGKYAKTFQENTYQVQSKLSEDIIEIKNKLISFEIDNVNTFNKDDLSNIQNKYNDQIKKKETQIENWQQILRQLTITDQINH